MADRVNTGAARLRGALKKLLPAAIVVVAGAAVAGLIAFLPARDRGAPPAELPLVSVETEALVALPEMADAFILHGVVEPNHTVMVAAEVSGQIKEIGCRESSIFAGGRSYEAGAPVAEGQPVVKGDCLVLLDTDLPQAECDRARAQAEYDAREFTRTQKLFDRSVATRAELDQARTAMEVSRASLAEAAERLERATITAPINGILNDLPEEVGQFVQPGTVVAQIVDIETVNVVVDVPERDVHYLSVGDRAEVIVDQLSGRQVAGTISFISELADERARTTRAEVSVNNKQRLLRSGQIVRARLARRMLKDVIMVPLESVIPLENGKVIYVVEDGRAIRRDVKIDFAFIKGTRVRVVSGLAAGDKLIVSGQRYVGPGQKVSVVADTSVDTGSGK